MSWKIAPIGRGGDLLYSQAGTPSLDLRFAEKKALTDYVSGNNLVTFSRSSSAGDATYVDSDGLIKRASVNLLTYSEQFDNAAWNKGGVSVTPNAILAPNGTLTADSFQEDTGTTVRYAVGNSISFDSGVTYCISGFFKAGTLGFIQLTFPSAAFGASQYANVDLTTGAVTVQTGGTASVESFSDGWYRCSFTATATVTTASTPGFAFINSGADGRVPTYTGTSRTLYIWGAQLETGSTATDYIPTTSSPGGAPRFDHDPTTGESLGLLVEESRTNLILDSEQVTSSNWARSNVSVTPNTTTAPNGTLTADSVSNIPSTFSWIRPNGSLNTSLTYTITFFAKPLTTNKLIVLEWQGGNYFDLSNPVSGVEEFADGWFKITLTKTNVSSGPAIYIGAYGPTSDNVTFALWGFQIEQGSFPTSYIPTTSATATRAADVVSITGTNFTNYFNNQEGTLFFKYQLTPSNFLIANRMLVAFADSINSFADVIGMWGSGPNRYVDTVGYNVAGTGWGDASYTPSSMSKYAIGYKVGTNTSNFAFNGTLQGSRNTSARTFNGLFIGGGPKNYISRLTYWPQRLPDATLQTITT